MNAVQTSKRTLCGPTWESCRGRLIWLGVESKATPRAHRGGRSSMHTRKARPTREAPGVAGDGRPDAREDQLRRPGVTEGPVVPSKPGHAGGGKGPQFKRNTSVGRDRSWAAYQLRKASKLQTTLPKAKAEAGSLLRSVRKITARIFWRMPMPCAAPMGAPGCGREDLADVEDYGVERWLGELALA